MQSNFSPNTEISLKKQVELAMDFTLQNYEEVESFNVVCLALHLHYSQYC